MKSLEMVPEHSQSQNKSIYNSRKRRKHENEDYTGHNYE